MHASDDRDDGVSDLMQGVNYGRDEGMVDKFVSCVFLGPVTGSRMDCRDGLSKPEANKPREGKGGQDNKSWIKTEEREREKV